MDDHAVGANQPLVLCELRRRALQLSLDSVDGTGGLEIAHYLRSVDCRAEQFAAGILVQISVSENGERSTSKTSGWTVE